MFEGGLGEKKKKEKEKVSWNAACACSMPRNNEFARQRAPSCRDRKDRKGAEEMRSRGEGKEKEGENALAQTTMQIFTRRASSFS